MKLAIISALLTVILSGCNWITSRVNACGAYQYAADLPCHNNHIKKGDEIDILIKKGTPRRKSRDVLFVFTEYDETIGRIRCVVDDINIDSGNYVLNVSNSECNLQLRGYDFGGSTVTVKQNEKSIPGTIMQPLIVVTIPLDIICDITLVPALVLFAISDP